MKKTVKINYYETDIDEQILHKLKEMDVVEFEDESQYRHHTKKTGTLVIEFIED